MTNAVIALTFERVAELLEQQGASPFRARAWREAAREISEHPRELTDVFRDHGRVGLEAIPHVGPGLSAVIIELVKTGRCSALERLQGDPIHALASVPGLGPQLAERIHRELGIETIEELETAAHDGRLAEVPGFGPRRIAALRGVLASLLARRTVLRTGPQRRPPVALLLDIDRAYREAVAAGTLPKIAPRRFNPKHEAWLPIMHVDRDGWSFTAMFSNTELAHRLGRTGDWVVVYYHEPHAPEGQATIVTEHRGWRRGRRVVRGRELECAKLADAEPEPARNTG
ncbi:MAG TPA: helix-hairpin-helix domain-containing protein [Kofleriaceae bacterium]|nr:helix-hairpin-helix domain-containing protein [Kofleriaceae bacterium]